MHKSAISWKDFVDKAEEAASAYSHLPRRVRMAINSGVCGLAGAGIGGMIGDKKRKAPAVMNGAAIGALAGALATETLDPPGWFKAMSRRGDRRHLMNYVGDRYRKAKRWLFGPDDKEKGREDE